MAPVRYFAIFGAMRTGSNLLERSLNQFGGLHCHGELFNPDFIGSAGVTELEGITLAAREADPQALIDRLAALEPGALSGFRIFDGHDRRIAQAALRDPACRRVILRRNPVDSYVSLKIARKTDQWVLGNIRARKVAQVMFDPAEYDAYVRGLAVYYRHLHRTMALAGQTAFELDYDDIKDLDVLNGLAGYLGSPDRLAALKEPIKRQNPEPLDQKVVNYEEMVAHLGKVAPIEGGDMGVGAPLGQLLGEFRARDDRKLLYAHVPGPDAGGVTRWMGQDTLTRFDRQKDLSDWLDRMPGSITFCVVAHPVARAFAVFCRRILSDGPGSYPRIRERLKAHHGVLLPGDAALGVKETAQSFEAFCVFLKANVAGQTGIRIDRDWAPQDELLESIGRIVPVRRVLREDEVAAFLGGMSLRKPSGTEPETVYPGLAAVYSKRVENLLSTAYARDYRKFGFGPWSGGL